MNQARKKLSLVQSSQTPLSLKCFTYLRARKRALCPIQKHSTMETSREDAKPGAASLDSAFQSASTSPFRSEGEATPSGTERTRSAACPASGSSTQYPNPLVYGSRGEEILVDARIRKSNNSLDAAGNSVETKQLPRRSLKACPR